MEEDDDEGREGAVGRLGNVANATKYLQKQRRNSRCNGVRRIVTTGKTSILFSSSPRGRRFGGITPVNSSNQRIQRRRNRRRKTAAPPPSEKSATRRLISRINLASVVNASSRRRRDLAPIDTRNSPCLIARDSSACLKAPITKKSMQGT